MSNLPKQYDPHKHETDIYKRWEGSGAFKPNGGEFFSREERKPFTVMLPLPNITGSLHMGHALQHSMTDTLIRYHRMKGEPTLWQPGTDHAGIATQNVVEKELRKEGLSRHDLGREEFLQRVWEWREKYGDEIVSQMKRMGSSCDWSRLTFTMDDDYVRAVQEAFVRYFEQGFVYRGNRIVNWCPRCASVISDLEINRVEKDAELFTLQYPFEDGAGFIEVATTRPETMLGDTAVAVNPEDERYGDMVGKRVRLPLADRVVPVVADERIDKEFGTGAVKVTPAHDPLDAEIGETHKLEAINVIGEDGMMTKEAGDFAGQAVEEAREKVVDVLEEECFLKGREAYRHSVTLCHRCDTPIEPLISRQWFVDMGKLKDETIEVAEKGVVEFWPERWKKNFLDWMENVHDWTISRQLWWGQRIPVWWKKGTRGTGEEGGNFVVSIEKPEGEGWERDPDVFDTWFSSALWPMATLGWPEYGDDLKRFYPTSVLITARDILYLWVARMIFSGLNFMQGEKYGNREQEERIPFEDVLIHPTVLTKKGQRMSKSLGTGIDPMELVEEYGADATRFGLIWQMSYDNQAIKFDEENIRMARNFGNKVWNMARFLESLEQAGEEKESLADRWIKQRLDETQEAVTELLEQYKVGEAAQVVYDFFWRDFADWYIEILKVEGSVDVAREVFKKSLVLLHPFMPHITEVLWEYQSKESESMLITYGWPGSDEVGLENGDVITDMKIFQEQVNAVRSARMLVGIPASAEVGLYIETPCLLSKSMEKLCRAKITDRNEPDSEGALVVPAGEGGNCVIYSDAITKDALQAAEEKLNKEREKLESLVARQKETLEKMKEKAPKEAVAEKKGDIEVLQAKLDKVNNSLAILGNRS